MPLRIELLLSVPNERERLLDQSNQDFELPGFRQFEPLTQRPQHQEPRHRQFAIELPAYAQLETVLWRALASARRHDRVFETLVHSLALP